MNLSTCTECLTVFEYEGKLPRRGSVCFRCHVKGVRLGFTHGKEDFHGPTIKERQDRQISEATANGLKPEPVGSRWV
jgi:hypothetical protein